MQGKRYMAIWAAIISVLCASLFLSGCGEQESGVQITNLQIEKDGRVISNIVEDFEKEIYTIEELDTMIQEEIAAYNKAVLDNTQHSQAISSEKVEISQEDQNKVLVTMLYASCEDYMAFNDEELFFGTIAQAKEAGFDLNVELVSASDDSHKITKEEIAGMADNHIFIIRENIQVTLSNKILYMTAGTELLNNKSFNVQNTDGLTYIIMK